MSDPGKPNRAEQARQEAATAQMSAAVAQARERRAQARAEYEERTSGLLFVKEFHGVNNAIMQDRFETASTRVLAWVRRYAWGEWSLFAIGVDGLPKYQVDCARELGLSPKRVSKAVQYLQQRGYLADRSKLLVPILEPVLSGPAPETDRKSPAWGAFLDLWKVAHSTDFEQLEVARATVAQIRKVRLTEYRKWKEEETKRRASLLEIAREGPGDPARLQSPTPFERDVDRHQMLEKAKPAPGEGRTQFDTHAYIATQIGQMQQAYPNSEFADPPIDLANPEHANAVRMIVDAIGKDEEDQVGYLVWVVSKFKGLGTDQRGIKRERYPGSPSGPATFGLLVRWAQDYARLLGKKPATRKAGK